MCDGGARLTPKGPRKAEFGGRRPTAGERFLGGGSESPLPISYGVWGSAVSSHDRKCILETLRAHKHASSDCKCRFIVVNRRVLNDLHNFQAAEKTWPPRLVGATAPGTPPPLVSCLRHCPWELISIIRPILNLRL